MKLYLIGYRCTGKTTIGKILAEDLNFNFIDTDQLIEQNFGLTISQIIEKHGWQKFRQIETKMLFTTQNKDNIVVATGGGIIINSKNQIFIKKNGICIWLDADKKTILHRLDTDNKTDLTRPSLTTHKSLLEETDEQLNLRKPLYEQTADMRIDTCFKDPKKIVTIINRRLS